MTTTASGDDGILCCDVGRERFAFRSRDVRHVERAECMRADRGDHGRIGTLRLGGQPVPVFALGEVLGQAAPADRPQIADGHIAVTGSRHAPAGWLVDRIVRVAQPAHADIAVLPSIVGARAASWFEGIVWLGDEESALLLSPDGLTSPFERDRPREADVAFERARGSAPGEPEPIAVVFSTSVLPASAARRYALSGRQVAAIVQPTPPTPLPGCSAFVRGITWWRRAAVPVIDFRSPADRDTPLRRRLIVQCGARQEGALIAFSIDAEVSMCRPAAGHRMLPDVPCPPFASGVFDVDGEPVALLDLDALLNSETHSAVS